MSLILPVNGLYGHARFNDRRSLYLLGAFLLVFHGITFFCFGLPLIIFDPDHAPFFGWGGYALRWLPIFTVFGALAFGALMYWHTHVVRRAVGFHFVDSPEEPRLCGIIEPLAITAGLGSIYVGVVESDALNAFACGVRRKDAVLVFTRGMVDGLDDEELAAVAAHEIAHVVAGDIRLIAAANAWMQLLRLMLKFDRSRTARARAAQGARLAAFQGFVGMAILGVILPGLLPVIVGLCWAAKKTEDSMYGIRKLFSTSREFVADAEAIRLTQNPAALISALKRIDGQSHITSLPPEQDAMMIDGATEGSLATHPAIVERIEAIVATTGPMALIASARRDTRKSKGFRRRGVDSDRRVPRSHRRPPTIDPRDGRLKTNRFGLTSDMTLGAVAAIGIVVGWHADDLGDPRKMAGHFSLEPVAKWTRLATEGLRCNVSLIIEGGKLSPECRNLQQDTEEFMPQMSGAFE